MEELPKVELPRVPANGEPVDGVFTQDVVVDEPSNIWLRLFVPVGAREANSNPAAHATFPVLFYFHGGGFVECSPDVLFFDRNCRILAKQNQVIVASICYRKAPQYKYPTAYEDCFKALEWFRAEHTNKFPAADISRSFLMGDSAGANIVHHVGVRIAQGAQDLKPLSILGHILLVPYFGAEERTPSEIAVQNVLLTVEACDHCWKQFLPEGATRDHPACRVLGPGFKDLAAIPLPPSLVIVAENDVLRDAGTRYAQALQELGKSVGFVLLQGVDHVFYADVELPKVPLFETVKEFLHPFLAARVSNDNCNRSPNPLSSI